MTKPIMTAIALMPVIATLPAHGQDELPRNRKFEAVAALYSDGSTSALLETTNIRPSTGTRIGISRRHTIGKSEPDSPLAGNETAVSGSFDYELSNSEDGLSPLTVSPTAGWLGSASPSADGELRTYSRWVGVSASIWTGQQTTRWTLDAQRTFINTTGLDVTDVDGKRILTPERIGGTSTGISWLHLATPSFLWRGKLSMNLRQDRPTATTGNIEGRQFIAPLMAAVHFGVSRFKNSGEIRPVTLTGAVSADSAFIEWHQKTGERTILAPGYRWYRETEVPRATNGERRTLGSDQIYATMRYRMWREYWLEDTDEVLVSAGVYQTSEPRKIWHVALGGSRSF
ncbi:MAG: hypothetical protein RIQ81_3 [Pseudomonadota bacterium]